MPPQVSQWVEMILERVETLPTLSPIATRLLAASNSDDFDLNEITTLIESDPSLTAKILGLCRRADKGLGDRITTVRRAIIMLGIETVRSAVLSVSVYDLMEQAASDADQRLAGELAGLGTARFDREGFWRHAIAVACASELIAEEHPQLKVRPDEAFVAGLLHDLGKLVLDLVMPKSFARVLEFADRRRSRSAPVERELFGIDHHVAGKRLAELWKLPEAVGEVMWLHSQPFEALPEGTNRTLVQIVTVAKGICRQLHLGEPADFDAPPTVDALIEQAGLRSNRVDGLVPRIHRSTAERCSAMGLGEQSSPELLLRSIFAANKSLGRLNTLLTARTRTAEGLERAVKAAEAFLGALEPGQSATRVLGMIARSARAAAGRGCVAALLRRGTDEPTQLFGFDAGERLTEPVVVGRDEAADLRAQANAIPVLGAERAGDDESGAMAAVLLEEPEGGGAPAWGVSREMRVLTLAWSMALSSAIEGDRARRLGEKLAQANRALGEAQSRLAEVESMSRLGEMTAGAAHEMNNPLTVISGRAQLLASRASDETSRRAIDAIVEATADLTDLISSLNLLADPPKPSASVVEVAQIVREAARIAGDRTGREAEIGEIGPGLRVEGDADLLSSALAELVINGLESADAARVRIWAEPAGADGRLTISVVDDGAGMSPRTRSHAFDPFFSDKPAGRSRGLGLSRARRVIELHGGEIGLVSEPGAGTTATIRLRAIEGAE
ncbi:MAG: HDOD domain-containing protein [Phycisphaerales bacterium JB037]